MTDKIFPTWISDRLPTEEEEGKQTYYINYRGEVDIVLGSSINKTDKVWALCGEEEIYKVRNILHLIATPEECLAREQENSNECGECGQEWEGDGDCPVCIREQGKEKIAGYEITGVDIMPSAEKFAEAEENDIIKLRIKQQAKKIKELEQAIYDRGEQALQKEKDIEELEKALADMTELKCSAITLGLKNFRELDETKEALAESEKRLKWREESNIELTKERASFSKLDKEIKSLLIIIDYLEKRIGRLE